MKRFMYYLPVLVIVGSNAFYDISAKSFPSMLNPQAGLTAVYLIAGAIALIIFFITSETKNFIGEIRKVNWAVFLLAAGCTGIDLGYILLFRAGWKISYGSLVCNIALGISMIIVGVLLYREKITKDRLIGISVCLVGLVLINT